MVDNPAPDRGALVKGPEVQESYTSEKWQPPRGCTARQYNGQPLTDQQALPEFGATANRMCVEAPDDGRRHRPERHHRPRLRRADGQRQLRLRHLEDQPVRRRPTPCTTPTGSTSTRPCRTARSRTCGPQDYIVSVDIPNDPVDGKPMYQVTKEEDVNVFDGDSYLPQENYPPATPADRDTTRRDRRTRLRCRPSSRRRSRRASSRPAPVPCTRWTSPTSAFNAGGGSPFQGYDRPLCGDKLVTVRSGQATAPNFNLFTAGADPDPLLGPHAQRPRPDAGQAQRQLRRGAGPALRAGRPLRLVRPAGRHHAHRLQRAVRGARAVDVDLQLPGAGRSVPEHVPLRRATTPASRGR